MAALQAVEAKEGLEVKGNSDIVGSITFQMLFKYFPKLAGMTVRCPAYCRAHSSSLHCARGAEGMCGCMAGLCNEANGHAALYSFARQLDLVWQSGAPAACKPHCEHGQVCHWGSCGLPVPAHSHDVCSHAQAGRLG